MYHVHSTSTANDSHENFKVTVGIQDTPITMEIDTGSSVTPITKADFLKTLDTCDTLKTPSVILKVYGGNKIKCIGEKEMKIQIGEKEDVCIKSVPQLSSARVKRWALLLAAYDYDIKYIPGKENCAADFLSRKPGHRKPSEEEQVPVQVLLIQEEQIINSKTVKEETAKDTILSKVKFTKDGWSTQPDESMIPYFRKRLEITVEDDILMWDSRVIIPKSLQELLLKDLHAEHQGSKWIPGVITKTLSPRNFEVQVGDVIWKRHQDQIRPRHIPLKEPHPPGHGRETGPPRISGTGVSQPPENRQTQPKQVPRNAVRHTAPDRESRETDLTMVTANPETVNPEDNCRDCELEQLDKRNNIETGQSAAVTGYRENQTHLRRSERSRKNPERLIENI
ncbi:hypothetical protein RRG08_013654 [Elysia crispata]|uniref:Uncharacterized protein n=1 Tax=Elysia crispata TaxID=231223 RepID=A0AAE1DR19_9GAST|nr:hypothetical protein RRG08_013654 [Elysia crispata]